MATGLIPFLFRFLRLCKMNAEGAIISKRDLAPTHYTFRIEAFSLLSKNSVTQYHSNVFESGGYKWKLVLYPNGNKKKNNKGYISVYLVMAEANSLPSDWEVNVLFSLYIYDHIKDKYVTFETFQEKGGRRRRFHKMMTEWGYSHFIPFETFKNPSNGYLVNDTCVFAAEVFVCENTRQGECLSMIKDLTTFNYTWKIENFSQLNDKYSFSDFFNVGAHKCKIKLYPRGDYTVKDKYLSLYMRFEDLTSPTVKKVYAKYVLRVRDQIYEDHLAYEGKAWFQASTEGWGWNKFMELSMLRDSTKGFLLNDICIIEAEVTVLGLVSSFT